MEVDGLFSEPLMEAVRRSDGSLAIYSSKVIVGQNNYN